MQIYEMPKKNIKLLQIPKGMKLLAIKCKRHQWFWKRSYTLLHLFIGLDDRLTSSENKLKI